MTRPAGGGAAVIDLAGFETQFPDTDTLRENIVSLTFAAQSVQETAAANTVKWSALQNQGVYSAPGQEIVYSAMAPVTSAADGLIETAEAAATALSAYADEAAEIKTTYLTGAKIEAQAFLDEIAGDPEWNSNRELTDQQDRILEKLTGLSQQMEESQRRCANALGLIWSGKTYGAADESGEAAPGETAYGLTGDAYGAVRDADLLPWARNAEWNYSGQKQGSIGQGVIMGMGDRTEELFGWAGAAVFLRGPEKGKAAWAGTRDLFFNFRLATSQSTADTALGREAQQKLRQMGKDAIEFDTWGQDPFRALGRNLFDVGTFLIPGGLIAKAGKAGSLVPGAGRRGPDYDGTAKGPLGPPRGRGTADGPSAHFDGVPDWSGTQQSPSAGSGVAVPPMPVPGSGEPGADAPGDDVPQQVQRTPVPGTGHIFDVQPRAGETGEGGGSWSLEPERKFGGPYQEHVTGVERLGPHWLEYVVPVDKTEQTPTGRVAFDGYFMDPGPPPVAVFQEAKDHYSHLLNIGDRMNEVIADWLTGPHGQFRAQGNIINKLPDSRLEWTFSEEAVAQRFLEAARSDALAGELLKEGKLVIKWTPKPGQAVG